MAVDIPELDQPGNKGLLRTRWFPLVMSEASLFLIIILLAASHWASAHGNSSYELKQHILRLRYEAVRAINIAIAQESPFLSDALVGAIAKMASYEAMFGGRERYSMHMRGLERAVQLRGGLDTLGLDGLLRRIVVWIDLNATFLNRWDRFFPGVGFVEDDLVMGEVEANPGHFLGCS